MLDKAQAGRKAKKAQLLGQPQKQHSPKAGLYQTKYTLDVLGSNNRAGTAASTAIAAGRKSHNRAKLTLFVWHHLDDAMNAGLGTGTTADAGEIRSNLNHGEYLLFCLIGADIRHFESCVLVCRENESKIKKYKERALRI